MVLDERIETFYSVPTRDLQARYPSRASDCCPDTYETSGYPLVLIRNATKLNSYPKWIPEYGVYEFAFPNTNLRFQGLLGARCRSKEKFRISIPPSPLCNYRSNAHISFVPHENTILDPVSRRIL